jgi:hypothetical protein
MRSTDPPKVATSTDIPPTDHGHRRQTSDTLDPDASEEAWEWLYNGRIATRRALLRAESCTVSVTQAGTRITWTIRPVMVVPLAHRHEAELPHCAYDVKPHVLGW